MKYDEYHCPRWQELPSIPLYMDQVLSVVEGALSPLCGTSVATAATVNSYVKAKLVSPPVKKKYSRGHMARLIVLYLFKRVLSMAEIKAVMEALFDGEDEVCYGRFCAALECGLAGEAVADCPPLCAAAIRACCGKLQVERLLHGDGVGCIK